MKTTKRSTRALARTVKLHWPKSTLLLREKSPSKPFSLLQRYNPVINICILTTL